MLFIHGTYWSYRRKKSKEHGKNKVLLEYLFVLTSNSDNISETQRLQQAIELEELKIQLLERQKQRQQLELDS